MNNTVSHPADGTVLGVVDGSLPATTRRFHVTLADDAVVQLDEIVVTESQLPDGRTLRHYGIVVEGSGLLEGASFASDTVAIADNISPGLVARRVEVQLLRTLPEMWIAPHPGAVVTRATGVTRDEALFIDQMAKPLPIGVDLNGEPVFVDFDFISGKKGGHVSVSGQSGVACKSTYTLFLLYQLLESPLRSVLGAHAPSTTALVFNAKGEDLMHIDRPNNSYAAKAATEDARWAAVGSARPGPFTSVALFAPRSERAHAGSAVTDIKSRPSTDVVCFGWSPEQFIKQGLLRFCFTGDDDRATQIGFIEQRVRLELARHCFPLVGERGAVVLVDDAPPGATQDFDREVTATRTPLTASEGTPIRDFGDLVSFLAGKLDGGGGGGEWAAGVTMGTTQAFLRRLFAMRNRIGHLICPGVSAVTLERAVNVVDISRLHDAAQRFVVGALLARMFAEKAGSGREPLKFVVLDELNKFAPREGSSPLKEILVDIAARGRSLGVILVGAQQSAVDVEPTIIRNAAIKVVGRLDASEASEYRFLSPELRERATRFLPGTMVLDQPVVPAPIPIRFPFPAFATNQDEGVAALSEAQIDELVALT